MSGKVTVIHWFRKGLRVHDNPALVKAVDEAIKRKVNLKKSFYFIHIKVQNYKL